MAPHSSFALDFLRRLLCAHSAGGDAAGIVRQRGAGDDAAVLRCEAQEEEEGEARSPCIVARLMGLDAMPAVAPARDQQPPLRRSRSASSAEGWPPPCCFGDAPRPRVIRTTSASFREKPTYLRRENDEFLILSFSPEEGEDDYDDKQGSSLLASRSDGDGDEEIARRRGKRRGDGGKKQRRGRRRPQRRRGFDEESAPGRSGTPVDCGLQNSSPVSVLEARDGQEESSTTSSSIEEAEPCSPSSGEIQPARQQQGSRRKLLQPDSDDLGSGLLPAASSTCRLSRCADRERGNRRAVNQNDDEMTTLPDVAGVWLLICRLLEEDINGAMKWGDRNDAKIAAEMESEILDQLICETTDELVQLI